MKYQGTQMKTSLSIPSKPICTSESLCIPYEPYPNNLGWGTNDLEVIIQITSKEGGLNLKVLMS